MSDRDFEPCGGRTVYEGRIVDVRVERFRYPDGEEVEREFVHHDGAAAVLPVGGGELWLVRQPREAVGDPDSLEIPAGRLDLEGESPRAAAERELAEEIGMRADRWEHLTTYRSSVGFTDEVVHVFLAEGLRPADGDHASGENERIEIVRRPLADLGALIGEVTDAKTLIALLLYARRRRD